METLEIRDLSFAYPEQRNDTLSHISFSIPRVNSSPCAAPAAAENPLFCGS